VTSISHYSNMTDHWSVDDVVEWLTRNHLEILCERFQSMWSVFILIIC